MAIIPAWIIEAYEKMVQTKAYGELVIKMEAGNPTTAKIGLTLKPPKDNPSEQPRR
jgi:hypothetical protein